MGAPLLIFWKRTFYKAWEISFYSQCIWKTGVSCCPEVAKDNCFFSFKRIYFFPIFTMDNGQLDMSWQMELKCFWHNWASIIHKWNNNNFVAIYFPLRNYDKLVVTCCTMREMTLIRRSRNPFDLHQAILLTGAGLQYHHIFIMSPIDHSFCRHHLQSFNDCNISWHL